MSVGSLWICFFLMPKLTASSCSPVNSTFFMYLSTYLLIYHERQKKYVGICEETSGHSHFLLYIKNILMFAEWQKVGESRMYCGHALTVKSRFHWHEDLFLWHFEYNFIRFLTQRTLLFCRLYDKIAIQKLMSWALYPM